MVTIVLDGLNEEEFRRSIQYRLREGSAALAVARLRALIVPYAGPGGLLPERFLTVTANDFELRGWDTLGDAMRRHDQIGRPVTAVSIAFGWPGDDAPVPDAMGQLRPHIETSYYNDSAFPFSHSSRDTLLESYSADGSTWAGDPEASDNAIGLDGIDDLNGALAALETHLLTSDEPDEAEFCAGSLGACLLSALLVEAVTARIVKDGLPRPLCVTAGSNGVYPYFDAPVAGIPDAELSAAAALEDSGAVPGDVPGPRYSSLLVTSIPRAKKRAVLVLEENDDKLADRLAVLRVHHHPSHAPAEPAEAAQQIDPVADPAGEVPLPEPEPEPESKPLPELAVADGGLLLAKKPAKHSYDFRDMLSPREDDLQLRLQSLISSHAAPALAPEQVVIAPPAQDLSDWTDWPDEPEIDAVSDAPISEEVWLEEAPLAPPATRLPFRLWANVKAWWTGTAD